jgi:hypothetical protein
MSSTSYEDCVFEIFAKGDENAKRCLVIRDYEYNSVNEAYYASQNVILGSKRKIYQDFYYPGFCYDDANFRYRYQEFYIYSSVFTFIVLLISMCCVAQIVSRNVENVNFRYTVNSGSGNESTSTTFRYSATTTHSSDTNEPNTYIV